MSVIASACEAIHLTQSEKMDCFGLKAGLAMTKPYELLRHLRREFFGQTVNAGS